MKLLRNFFTSIALTVSLIGGSALANVNPSYIERTPYRTVQTEVCTEANTPDGIVASIHKYGFKVTEEVNLKGFDFENLARILIKMGSGPLPDRVDNLHLYAIVNAQGAEGVFLTARRGECTAGSIFLTLPTFMEVWKQFIGKDA